ncbi:MAG: metal ABC transporter solute-binding protein, Zn/Mn family [Chthoniobacterales bacterium]
MLATSVLQAEPVKIVAAENFYGDIAKQIGGSAVKVTAILNNPNQDPHEFQADAATAILIADADIIIYNGIGYDSWMEKLLQARGDKKRKIIKIADLVGATMGQNPHLWYNPQVMPELAEKLSELLHKPTEFALFSSSMKPLAEKITEIRKKYAGTKVTATEPIFAYMARALGLEMLNSDYQVAMMNGTEPSFQQTAEFQNSVTDKRVKILFYNNQVLTPSTERMQALAQKNNIPIVGLSEMQPASAKNYQEWMMSELARLEAALLPSKER